MTVATLPEILVVGKESVGKTQLLASLTRSINRATNFRGSTLAMERYRWGERILWDSPGILRHSDTQTTQTALDALDEQAQVMLVVQAPNLDQDLEDLLPLVQHKQGIVVVTFWDQVEPTSQSTDFLQRLVEELGVLVLAVDGRRLSAEQCHQIDAAWQTPGRFAKDRVVTKAHWRITPKPTWLDHPIVGPWLAVALLVIPALLTIFGANRFADWLHPLVADALAPAINWLNANAPWWVQLVLTYEHQGFGYGLLNMGPFLLVWALPTVVLFALILGTYKASGLMESITVALHPWVRRLGLSGRDITRVMMGFGCNVPAVIHTRACSSCSRGPAMAAIAFGAACSYQLPATLAVLAATAKTQAVSWVWLVGCYLGYLFLTTMVYLRLTSPAEARSSLNVLMIPTRPFLQWPTIKAVWLEARSTIIQFLVQALPIFAVICVIACLLAASGAVDLLAWWLGPLMGLFRLPAEVSIPVVLASVRKDGIFLLAAEGVQILDAVQILTAVYLAGVLLPCLVTMLTIARESTWKFAGRLLLQQATAATVFSLLLAWGGWWLLELRP